MSSTSASALQAMAKRHRLSNGYLRGMPEDTPRLESADTLIALIRGCSTYRTTVLLDVTGDSGR